MKVTRKLRRIYRSRLGKYRTPKKVANGKKLAMVKKFYKVEK